jgi:chromosome segregation ATPase
LTWAAVWEAARWLLPVVAAAIAWWVRDRRKDRAAADVAERTVPAEVALKDAGADVARLVYVQKEMDTERSFHRQQIADRDAEIERQRAELAHRDDLIARLRVEAEDLRDRLAEATRQLTSVLARLDELSEETYPPVTP